MNRASVSKIVGTLAVGALAVVGTARADEQSCQRSFERAQELRDAGNALDARRELVRCEQSCPESLRRYCAVWRTEVDSKLAQVLLVVRERDRAEPLDDAMVRVDGQPRSGSLSEPIVLVPGAHRIELEWRGQRIVREVTLRAGRAVETVLAVFEPAVSPQPEPSAGYHPAVPWTIGAFGLAAMITGGVVVLHGHLERADAEDECAPSCSPDLAAGIEREWIGGGIALGAGALLVGTAIIIFAGGDGDSDSDAAQPSLAWHFEVGPRGVGLAGQW